MNQTDIDYRNPVPVAVCLVAVETVQDGVLQLRLLGIVRGIEPAVGEIALPGGYVDELEDLKMAASRECREETGLELAPSDWLLHTARTSPRNRLLLFLLHRHMLDEGVIERCVHNDEVSGFALIGPDTRLGLPLHQDVVRRYFENSAAGGRQVTLPDDEPHGA